jgi:PadR family transcriptional regulator PadR
MWWVASGVGALSVTYRKCSHRVGAGFEPTARLLARRAAPSHPSTHLMTGRPMARTPPEMLQGTVDILILRALAWDSMHGYAISRWIDARSEGALAVDGAALYQALHRLANRKWVAAEWGVSENNRKAKFYSITAAGRAQLRAESATWARYADAVTKVLRPA